LVAAPAGTAASFYRTRSGAEIDLLLELPGGRGIWAIEVKLGLAPKLSRGFHHACEDIGPRRAFVIYSGDERYPLSKDAVAIGLRGMVEMLAES